MRQVLNDGNLMICMAEASHNWSFFLYIILLKKKENKKHSENADTSTLVTFDLEVLTLRPGQESI